MKHFSRVLGAVDFSKPAPGAFEYTLALSQHHGAELVLVHAGAPSEGLSRQADKRLALIADLRQRAGQPSIALTETLHHRDPAAAILWHARSLTPDLIVMDTHRHGRLDHTRARWVSEHVVVRATVPVLAIPDNCQTSTIRPFRHAVVGVDFSASSNRAIDEASTLAGNPGDRLTLVHVLPGFASPASPYVDAYGRVGYHDELLRDAQRRLQLAVPAKRTTPAAVHARVLLGDITTRIHDAVDRAGADLLVVGVPKRGSVSRALFGVTAARLLKATRVPMLAVPEVQANPGREGRASVPEAA